MKLSHILIAGLLSSSLLASASTGDNKAKKNTKCVKKTETKKTKVEKKKAAVVSTKKVDVCEACGRG